MAIKKLQYNALSPGQWLARPIIRRTQHFVQCATAVEIYSVPDDMVVEGNENADEAAKKTMERADTRRYPERFALLTHVGRMILERKWKEAKH